MSNNLDDRNNQSSGDVKGNLREAEILRSVRQLYDALERFDRAASDAIGIGVTDLKALNLLEAGAMPAGEIGQRLGLKSASITALIDRLALAGLIEREAGREDRRQVWVRLTQKGYQAGGRVFGLLGRQIGETYRTAPAQMSEQASAVLKALAGACEDAAGAIQTYEGGN